MMMMMMMMMMTMMMMMMMMICRGCSTSKSDRTHSFKHSHPSLFFLQIENDWMESPHGFKPNHLRWSYILCMVLWQMILLWMLKTYQTNHLAKGHTWSLLYAKSASSALPTLPLATLRDLVANETIVVSSPQMMHVFKRLPDSYPCKTIRSNPVIKVQFHQTWISHLDKCLALV